MRPRISIRGLVRPSVGWSVGPLVGYAFVKIDEKWPFMDSKWLRRVLDEEERGTRRKEGRGGRRGEEEGATRRRERRGEWKNKKVVKKWKMKKWLEDASLTSGSCSGSNWLYNINRDRGNYGITASSFVHKRTQKRKHTHQRTRTRRRTSAFANAHKIALARAVALKKSSSCELTWLLRAQVHARAHSHTQAHVHTR